MAKIWHRNPTSRRPIGDDVRELAELTFNTSERDRLPNMWLRELFAITRSADYVNAVAKGAALVVVDFLFEEGDQLRTAFVQPRLADLIDTAQTLRKRYGDNASKKGTD